MKSSFFILPFIVSLLLFNSSCKVLPPVYKGIQNPKIDRVGLTGIKFGAEVAFYNPNRIKCKINDIAFDVKMDEKQVATIGEKCDIPVHRRSDFVIPVGVALNPQGTILENIATIVEIFRDKESTLSLSGNIKVKVFGITFPIPVKYQQKIKLSQLKAG